MSGEIRTTGWIYGPGRRRADRLFARCDVTVSEHSYTVVLKDTPRCEEWQEVHFTIHPGMATRRGDTLTIYPST